MIIYLYLFISLNVLSIESSSIRGENFKNELVPYANSKMDFSRKGDDNLGIANQEPFILPMEMPPGSENESNKNGKEKKKRPSSKRFSKAKLLRKKHRIRRDVNTSDVGVISRGKGGKLNQPVKQLKDKPVKNSSNFTISTLYTLPNSISRQDIVKALTQNLNEEKKKLKYESEERENSNEFSSMEEDDENMFRWLRSGTDKPNKNLQHHHLQFSDNAPFVRMKNPEFQRQSYHDLIVDRERLEQKIKNLKNLLRLNESDSSDDGIRVRRKIESDRAANKIAKMFLTLSAVNDFHQKRKVRCKGEENNVGDIWEEERKSSTSRKSSSSNEQRYKVKKWIEHLKSKRSSRYCPCSTSSPKEEADLFPLEEKLLRDYSSSDINRNSEESSETLQRERESFPKYDQHSRGKPIKAGLFRSRSVKSSKDSDRYAVTKAGKKKSELPFEDLEVYRSRAKQILQNAEEILDKIKEEEEKRKSMPNYLMNHLKELTSRIQADPRNSENDLIRMIQKSLGWSPKSHEDENEGGYLTDSVKSYILDPYEKAKNLTEESARQLSSYLLKNLGKFGEIEKQPEEATGNGKIKIDFPDTDKIEAVEPQVYYGQEQLIKEAELSFDNLRKESPKEDNVESKEPEVGLDSESETLPSKSKPVLKGNGKKANGGQNNVPTATKNVEDKIRKKTEDARKKNDEKLREGAEKNSKSKKEQPEKDGSEETVAAEHYLKEDEKENGKKSEVEEDKAHSIDLTDLLLGAREQENRKLETSGDVNSGGDVDEYEDFTSKYSTDSGKHDQPVGEDLKQGKSDDRQKTTSKNIVEETDTVASEHTKEQDVESENSDKTTEGNDSKSSKEDALRIERNENDVLASKHLVRLDDGQTQTGDGSKQTPEVESEATGISRLEHEDDSIGNEGENTVAGEHVPDSNEGVIQAKKTEKEGLDEGDDGTTGAKYLPGSDETTDKNEKNEKALEKAVEHASNTQENQSPEQRTNEDDQITQSQKTTSPKNSMVDNTNKEDILASKHSSENKDELNNEGVTLIAKSKEEENKNKKKPSAEKKPLMNKKFKQGISGDESSENESTSKEHINDENEEKEEKLKKDEKLHSLENDEDKSLDDQDDGNTQSDNNSNVVGMPDKISELLSDPSKDDREDSVNKKGDTNVEDLTKSGDDAIVKEESVKDELLQNSEKTEDPSDEAEDDKPTPEFVENQNPDESLGQEPEKLSHLIENLDHPEAGGKEDILESEKPTDKEKSKEQEKNDAIFPEEMKKSDTLQPEEIMASQENLDGNFDVENDKTILQAENTNEGFKKEEGNKEDGIERILEAITEELIRQESGERFPEERESENLREANPAEDLYNQAPEGENLNYEAEADPFLKEANIFEELDNKASVETLRENQGSLEATDAENFNKNVEEETVLEAAKPEIEDLIREAPEEDLNEEVDTKSLLKEVDPTEDLNKEVSSEKELYGREETSMREANPAEDLNSQILEENADGNNESLLKSENLAAKENIPTPDESADDDEETSLMGANPTKELNDETHDKEGDDNSKILLRAANPTNEENDQTSEKEVENGDSETPLRAALPTDNETSKIFEKEINDGEGETPLRAAHPHEETGETSEKDVDYSNDETPLKAIHSTDGETGEISKKDVDDGGDETPLRAEHSTGEDTNQTSEKHVDEGEDETPLRAAHSTDDETTKHLEKEIYDGNDETPLRAVHSTDEDINQTSEKQVDNGDNETPLRAEHSTGEDTNQTSEKHVDQDEEETSLRAVHAPDDETNQTSEKHVDNGEDKTPLRAVHSTDEDSNQTFEKGVEDDNDETPLRATHSTDEDINQTSDRDVGDGDVETRQIPEKGVVDGSDETPLEAVQSTDEFNKQIQNRKVEEGGGDETPLRSSNPSEPDAQTLDEKVDNVNEDVEDDTPLRSANPSELDIETLDAEVDNIDKDAEDETPLKAANPENELNSQPPDENAKIQDTGKDGDDATLLREANPVEESKEVDNVKDMALTKLTAEEPLESNGKLLSRPDQILRENLQNLDPYSREPKGGQLKVPKSIRNIMKDLEGKARDDATSIQNLDPEKIDHFIEKIDEVEQQNLKDGLDDDCRKECACADEIDLKARNRGRYEIAKDFLHWMKDLRLNRVLSDN